MARRSSDHPVRRCGAVPGAIVLLAVLLALPLGEAGAPHIMPVAVETQATPTPDGEVAVDVAFRGAPAQGEAVSYQIGSTVAVAGTVGRFDRVLPASTAVHAGSHWHITDTFDHTDGASKVRMAAPDEHPPATPFRTLAFDAPAVTSQPHDATFARLDAQDTWWTQVLHPPVDEGTPVQFDLLDAPRYAPRDAQGTWTITMPGPSAAPPDAHPLTPTDLPGLEIHWGPARNVTVAHDGEAFARESITIAPAETDEETPQLFVRVWTRGDGGDAVILPVGSSYTPPTNGPTAPWYAVAGDLAGRALALATALAAICGTVTINTHPKHRDWDFPVPVPWPIFWLFTRLRRNKVLDHPTRRTILAMIEANPGIRFYELRDRAGLSVGVLSHHLRMMTDHDLILLRRCGRRVHAYAKGTPTGDPAHELSERQTRILSLVAGGTTTQTAIAKRLGLTQQAVSYHLRQLANQGLVRRQRGRGRTGHYELTEDAVRAAKQDCPASFDEPGQSAATA